MFWKSYSVPSITEYNFPSNAINCKDTIFCNDKNELDKINQSIYTILKCVTIFKCNTGLKIHGSEIILVLHNGIMAWWYDDNMFQCLVGNVGVLLCQQTSPIKKMTCWLQICCHVGKMLMILGQHMLRVGPTHHQILLTGSCHVNMIFHVNKTSANMLADFLDRTKR